MAGQDFAIQGTITGLYYKHGSGENKGFFAQAGSENLLLYYGKGYQGARIGPTDVGKCVMLKGTITQFEGSNGTPVTCRFVYTAPVAVSGPPPQPVAQPPAQAAAPTSVPPPNATGVAPSPTVEDVTRAFPGASVSGEGVQSATATVGNGEIDTLLRMRGIIEIAHMLNSGKDKDEVRRMLEVARVLYHEQIAKVA